MGGGSLDGKTILVTGCTGFIGAHVVMHLMRLEKEKGETVYVRGSVRRKGDAGKLIDLFDDGWSSRFSEVICDLMSEDNWDTVCQGCDIIIHVASPVSLKNNDNDIPMLPLCFSACQGWGLAGKTLAKGGPSWSLDSLFFEK